MNPHQKNDEWNQYLPGMLTSSNMQKLSYKDTSTSRHQVLIQKAKERATGKPHYIQSQGNPDNVQALRRGTENEPIARRLYTLITGREIEDIGFVRHPLLEMVGAAPDGLVVGTLGLVEFKCPFSNTHAEFVNSGIIKEEYQRQMGLQMMCTCRHWCDFVSFDPDLYDEGLPNAQFIKWKRFYLTPALENEIKQICVRANRDIKRIMNTIEPPAGTNINPEFPHHG